MAANPHPAVESRRPRRRFSLVREPEPAAPEPARPRRPGVSYRRIAVGLGAGDASRQAVALACRIAAEQHPVLFAIAAIEVPLDMPLDAPDRAVETAALDAVHTAQTIAASYGVRVEGIVLHARDAGEAIVAEATLRRADVVIVAAEWPRAGQQVSLDRTTDHVLKHAPCRVMLLGSAAADSQQHAESEPVFRAGRVGDYWPTGEFVDRSCAPLRRA